MRRRLAPLAAALLLPGPAQAHAFALRYDLPLPLWLCVAGGRPPRGHDFAVYNPAADSWTVLPDLPSQRNHIAGAAIDGRIYVAGGRLGGGFRSDAAAALIDGLIPYAGWRDGGRRQQRRHAAPGLCARSDLRVRPGGAASKRPGRRTPSLTIGWG